MFVRLNIFSLICICLNSALHSSSFFFTKLPEAYAIFNPIVDFMSVIPLFFLLIYIYIYTKSKKIKKKVKLA
ncbi:hypothetical protein GIB67_020110 [Kingdonia uniflora]|uniref:Photosystem II protein K n=1 Tax=Kingdonia uniflora TaxID=39325 RepID=A0A7J7L2K7_9MAGN|nr:hypothetical protein GIB67_020110 [Kingdonia uniflora]